MNSQQFCKLIIDDNDFEKIREDEGFKIFLMSFVMKNNNSLKKNIPYLLNRTVSKLSR